MPKPNYVAINNRTGRRVYEGPKEKEAARKARAAAEENAQIQTLAAGTADVYRDGVKLYYYETDPTAGRMKARKVFASMAVALARK